MRSGDVSSPELSPTIVNKQRNSLKVKFTEISTEKMITGEDQNPVQVKVHLTQNSSKKDNTIIGRT